MEYKVTDLLTKAFGIKGVNMYKSKMDVSGSASGNQLDYSGVEVVEDVAEASRLSYLGTPIIYPIVLKGKSYKAYGEDGALKDVRLENFELPVVSFSSFRRAKVMSQTRVVAGYGTVKETYGFTDWQIDIRGLCLRDPSHLTAKTAFEQHLELLKYDRVVESIGVLSELYNDKGIDNIVIQEIGFGQIEGKPGAIPFTMRCVSDQPLELVL